MHLYSEALAPVIFCYSFTMFLDSPWLVPPGEPFSLAGRSTEPPKRLTKSDAKSKLKEHVKGISAFQERLFSQDRQALLLVFQAMDAAGKDGTIRRLLTGINPAGCQVTSFQRPSSLELDHDFLWRHVRYLPERGRIGVHNRSWYEEVLVVRVNEGMLTNSQRLPSSCLVADVWEGRMRSIREFESHLCRNGTTVVKFFLNVGQVEQTRRLLARIDEPEKRWKFDPRDLDVREQWAAYQSAYEAALTQTSTADAPWYAIPADHKWTMRVAVAEIVHQTLARMDPAVPSPDDIDWGEARRRLNS